MGRTLTILALLLGLTCTGCASESVVRVGGRISLAAHGEQPASFSITRSAFVAALERGPSWLIQNVTVRPVLLDRTFYGFQLVTLFPEDPNLQRLPIQTGDIVQQVNGLPIERPDQFMQVWQSLSTADHLSIRVIRDGRPLMITWLIQPDSPGERTVSYGEPNAR